MIRRCNFDVRDNSLAVATYTGDFARITAGGGVGRGCNTLRLNADEYLVKSTGEIKRYNRSRVRTDNVRSMRATHQRLIDLFNCNFPYSAVKRTTMVTLTYKENQTDGKLAWADWHRFISAFRLKLKRASIACPEYIVVIEPQGRGAWHFHVYFLWPNKIPRLNYSDYFVNLWKHGFVKVSRVHCRKGSNLGAYFGSYFSDVPVDELDGLPYNADDVKIRNGKKIVKQGRLSLYPPGMHYYSCSRGVKRPEKSSVTLYSALTKKMASAGGHRTYHSSFIVASDDTPRSFLISRDYYSFDNSKSDSVCQEKFLSYEGCNNEDDNFSVGASRLAEQQRRAVYKYLAGIDFSGANNLALHPVEGILIRDVSLPPDWHDADMVAFAPSYDVE